jgi:putative endonuclease
MMRQMKNYWVYILSNWNGSVLYIGMTNDLVRRVGEHRAGTGSEFTRRYRACKLVYCEHTTEVESAIRREKQLKSWRRSKKEALISAMNPAWADLAPTMME